MSLTVTINNVVTDFVSVSRPDRIDQATECTIVVQDTTGTTYYQKGQPVTVTDTNLGTIFTGVINQPQANRISAGAPKEWRLECKAKGDYRAGKRTSNKSYANQYGGTIVVDMVQRDLAAEGITAKAALDWDEELTTWQAGTLTNTVATTNASNGNPGGGDLELALAGSAVNISIATSGNFNAGTYSGTSLVNGVLQPTATNAIKIVATCTLSGAGNLYSYFQIWSGSYTIVSSSYFVYTIWIDAASKEKKLACDLTFSDGTTLRDNFINPDQQSVSPHPNTDLTGLADGQWYYRQFWIDNFAGKTLVSVMVAAEGDTTGTYTAWFKDIRITNSSFVTLLTIFSTSLNTAQQISANGYTSTSVSVVPTYNIPFYNPQGEGSSPWTPTVPTWTSAAISIDAAKLLQSSYLSYRASLPDGILVNVLYSLDYGSNSAQIICSNNAALPSLPAGLNVASRSVTLIVKFYRDPDATNQASPQSCPTLSAISLALRSAYAMTKTDIQFACLQASDWTQTGTSLSNTATSGKVLQLSGYVNNFDTGPGNATLYGTQTPNVYQDNRRVRLDVSSGGDARLRLDDAGQWQNFTLEVDISIHQYFETSVNYRCTGWQNAQDTYAYVATFTTTIFKLGRGTNTSSGGGAFTQIGSTVTLALTSGNVYRVKIVVSGSSHSIYLNNNLLGGAAYTDGTFSAAGYIGLRIANSTGSRQQAWFDNFGVVAALSGTWTSPNILLTSATTYGTSVISWRDQDEDSSNCSLKLEATVNGGINWYTCTSGAILPVLSAGQSLSGINLKIRATLTTTTATSMPGLDNLVVRVLQQYSASGTRVSPSLSLASVGRADTALVNWNALLLTGTGLIVQTSTNSGSTYQTISTPGGAISGISVQPDPVTDTFNTNTSANYTQSNIGGTTGTWIWDTANSRLTGSGGNVGTLLYNTALTSADNWVMADFDEADGSGLVANRSVTGGYCYYTQIWDASASGTPNTAKLFRRASSTTVQVGSTATISFVRGSVRRFMLDVQGGVLTVSMDGVSIITYTDGSPLGAGNAGFELGALARIYSLRIQQYGQNVSSLSVLTKLTLSSTDPTATPQVLDLQTFVSSTDIGPGVLIPKTPYSHTYVDKNVNDLAQKSLYWSYFRSDLAVVFQARTAIPAPFAISATNITSIGGQPFYDIMEPTELDNSGDSYRNRMIMQNAIATNDYTEILTGDGSRRAWNTSHPLSDPPTSILLNGQIATFGIKNVDTGMQFYYQRESTAIDQDSNEPLLEGVDSITIVYSGTSSQDVIRDNTGLPGTISQSQMAIIENAAGGASSSGIVEVVVDASSMTVAQATTVADQELQRHGVIGRTFKFMTARTGLLPGMQLAMFVPDWGFWDAQLLVTEVNIVPDWDNSVSGNILYLWEVTVTEAANLGTWVKMFADAL